jgi:hypothetical protein
MKNLKKTFAIAAAAFAMTGAISAQEQAQEISPEQKAGLVQRYDDMSAKKQQQVQFVAKALAAAPSEADFAILVKDFQTKTGEQVLKTVKELEALSDEDFGAALKQALADNHDSLSRTALGDLLGIIVKDNMISSVDLGKEMRKGIAATIPLIAKSIPREDKTVQGDDGQPVTRLGKKSRLFAIRRQEAEKAGKPFNKKAAELDILNMSDDAINQDPGFLQAIHTGIYVGGSGLAIVFSPRLEANLKAANIVSPGDTRLEAGLQKIGATPEQTKAALELAMQAGGGDPDQGANIIKAMVDAVSARPPSPSVTAAPTNG